MKTFTITVTDERWARRLEVVNPVPEESEFTEEELAVQSAIEDFNGGLLKREKRKNRYQPVAVGKDDITITVE